jgi:dihydropteroate synthase
MLHPQHTLNCKGRLLTLDRPLVMGILNLTPDSFFEGSRVQNGAGLLARAGQMLAEGADILDIGGMSSRPGSDVVSEEEELKRVLPAIEALHRRFPQAILSADTVRASVARQAVEAGASMINDISAGRLDEAMYETVAALRVPYVLMHMQGTPRTMQDAPRYHDVVAEVTDHLVQRAETARAAGVVEIYLDPGIGFGKTAAHNWALLAAVPRLVATGWPVAIGTSRKAFLGQLLGSVDGAPAPVEDRLEGSVATAVRAVLDGAALVRVHDVGATVGALRAAAA